MIIVRVVFVRSAVLVRVQFAVFLLVKPFGQTVIQSPTTFLRCGREPLFDVQLPFNNERDQRAAHPGKQCRMVGLDPIRFAQDSKGQHRHHAPQHSQRGHK